MDALRKSANELRVLFGEKLAAAGFEDEHTYQLAKLPDAETEALDRQIYVTKGLKGSRIEIRV